MKRTQLVPPLPVGEEKGRNGEKGEGRKVLLYLLFIILNLL